MIGDPLQKGMIRQFLYPFAAALRLRRRTNGEAGGRDGRPLMPLLLILLIGVGGWVLGVAGFFHARRALSETRLLRLATDSGAAPTPAARPAYTAPVPPPASAEVPGAPQAPMPAVPQGQEGKTWDIEALLTARWGVWLGAAALVLAGVFLVRYAVDAGPARSRPPLRAGRRCWAPR